MFRNSAGCSTHGVAFGFGKGSKCCKNSSVRLSLSLNAGRFLACHAFGVQPVAAGVEAGAVDTLTSGGSASSWRAICRSAPQACSWTAPQGKGGGLSAKAQKKLRKAIDKLKQTESYSAGQIELYNKGLHSNTRNKLR